MMDERVREAAKRLQNEVWISKDRSQFRDDIALLVATVLLDDGGYCECDLLPTLDEMDLNRCACCGRLIA